MSKEPKFAEATGRSILNKEGAEILDPTPVEIPIGFERPESIQSMIRRLVLDPQLREELQNQGAETFDEADDFDIADDDVPQSPHEENFDPMHLLAREQEINSGFVKPRSKEEIEAANKAINDYRASQQKKDKNEGFDEERPKEKGA